MTKTGGRGLRSDAALSSWLVAMSLSLSVGAILLGISFDGASADRSGTILAAAAANAALIAIAALLRRGRGLVGIDSVILFLGVALVSGTVVPLLNAVFGAPVLSNRINAAPSGASVAVGLAVTFNASVIAGWFASTGGPRDRHPITPAFRASASTVGSLIFLGLFGLVVRFPSLASVQGFLSGDYNAIVGGPQGILGFLSSATRPLLAVGTFCLARRVRGATRVFALMTLTPLSVLALVSFSLNRASLLYCAMALLLVALRGRSRGVTVRFVGMVAAGAVLFLAVGPLRTGLFLSEGGRYDVEVTQTPIVEDLYRNVSVYAQTPFIVGVLYDGSRPLELGPSSIAASLLSPIPRLGTEFRDSSGTARYNQALYGTTAIVDQILPIYAELDIALGVPGVLLGGVLIGTLIARLDRSLAQRKGEVAVYALTLAGIWLAQASIVSFQILSQVFVFFVGPLWLISTQLGHYEVPEELLDRARS